MRHLIDKDALVAEGGRNMKATELMIGDWVKINYRGKFVKVTAIHDGLIDTTAVSPLMEDEYESIPLTAEILEKNLSTTSQIQYCWDDFLSNSFGEDFYEIRYHGDVTELVISICYVHELQHILKLCKIEKTIEL